MTRGQARRKLEYSIQLGVDWHKANYLPREGR